MDRFLCTLIVLTNVTGLVISSGCIAIPVGLQNVNANNPSILPKNEMTENNTQEEQAISPGYSRSTMDSETPITNKKIQTATGNEIVQTTPAENATNGQQNVLKDPYKSRDGIYISNLRTVTSSSTPTK